MKKILFVLVVLLVGGVAVSGCLGTSSGPGGISIPSNYEKTTTTQVEEGVTMTQYVVETGDSSQVLDDLKQSAQTAGWEVMTEYDESMGGYESAVLLEKGDEGMAIVIIQSNGQTNVGIIKGLKDSSGME